MSEVLFINCDDKTKVDDLKILLASLLYKFDESKFSEAISLHERYLNQLCDVLKSKNVVSAYQPYLTHLFNKVLYKPNTELDVQIDRLKVSGCRVENTFKIENIIFTIDDFIEPDETFKELLGYLIITFDQLNLVDTFQFSLNAISTLDLLSRVLHDKTFEKISDVMKEFEEYGMKKIETKVVSVQFKLSNVSDEITQVIEEFKILYENTFTTEQKNFNTYRLTLDANEISFSTSLDDKHLQFNLLKQFTELKFKSMKPSLIKLINKISHGHRSIHATDIEGFRKSIGPLLQSKLAKNLVKEIINLEIYNLPRVVKIEDKYTKTFENYILPPYFNEDLLKQFLENNSEFKIGNCPFKFKADSFKM